MKTPENLVDSYISKIRQTGRTTELIQSLPDEPCAVIVLRWHMISRFKDIIKKIRPDYNINNIMFLSYNKTGNYPHLRGYRLPVYVDNAVLDYMQCDFLSSLQFKNN